MLKRTTKPLRRRVLIGEGLSKSSKKQHSENTDKWHLCKAGSFSYGESPRTPPLEGTSLHRWNDCVERPWGILSLFTTCLRLGVKSPCHRLWHVDYPQKHTKKRETLRNANQNKTTRKAGYKKVYDRPLPPPPHQPPSTPLPTTSNEAFRIKGALKKTDKWHLCKAGSFSYGESPRTPPLEGTSLHQWNNSVERPWGILSLFITCLQLCVKSPCHRLWHVHYPWKAH